jgi:hypothetical protein
VSDEAQRRKVRRLQNQILAVAIIVVFLGIAAPTAVIIYFNQEADQTQTAIVCENAETTILLLEAAIRNGDIAESIARSLGLPIPPPPPIVIPEVPPECIDISPSPQPSP